MKLWIDPKLCHGATGPSDCQVCFDKLLRHRPCLTGYEDDRSNTITVFVKTELYQTFTLPADGARVEAGAASGPNPA